MKYLMARSDGPAIRDTAIWLGLMVLRALVASILSHLGLRAVLLGLRRAVWVCLRQPLARNRPGTAFKTGWMNDVVYQIASFMVARNPVNWRWILRSHPLGHTGLSLTEFSFGCAGIAGVYQACPDDRATATLTAA